MADTGWVFAGAGASTARAGSSDSWHTTPGNITADDGNRTESFGGGGNTFGYSDWLVGDTFGLSVPGGATIDGIEVEYERRGGGSGTQFGSDALRIVKGGSIGSTDKAPAGDWAEAWIADTIGGAADLWGETWTDTDTNAGNFGFALSAYNDLNSTTFNEAWVDYFKIKVYYTEDVGGLSIPIAAYHHNHNIGSNL